MVPVGMQTGTQQHAQGEGLETSESRKKNTCWSMHQITARGWYDEATCETQEHVSKMSQGFVLKTQLRKVVSVKGKRSRER